MGAGARAGAKAFRLPQRWRRMWFQHRSAAAGGVGAVYGLGFLGALVYYIQTSTSFGAGLLGVVKALLWPGFLVYGLMQHVGA